MLDPTLPDRFTGPAAWDGPEMARQPERWVWDLSAAEITELEGAAGRYLESGRDVGAMRAADFQAPGLAGRFGRLRADLLTGHGFALIRGLPVERLSRAEAAAIFCGIGAQLGRMRSQNAAGHVLGHVRNTGADPTDPGVRIYQTNARQSFHTDSADVVGLLCLAQAREGGDSLLVSAETLYNRLRAEAPDLLPRLFDPIATDRRGETPAGMQPFMTIPPLNWHAGKLTVFYQRQYIDSAQRFPDALRLTPDHVAALDRFDAAADDPDLHLRMRLEPGDMQFVYNHSQLHDRTGFTDHADPARRRHLFRLWLSAPGDRPLPPCFAQRYGDLSIGDRGGILVAPDVRLSAPLD